MLTQQYRQFIDEVFWDSTGQIATATGKMFDLKISANATDVLVDIDLKGFAAKLARAQITSGIEKILISTYG